MTATSAPAAKGGPTGTMSEILTLTDAVQERLAADVRKCMADEDFPQMMQAHELTAQRTDRCLRGKLNAYP